MTATSQQGQTIDPRATLRAAWRTERDAARAAGRAGDPALEWRHLERAHILSQPLAGIHLRIHGAMLAAAIRRREVRETVGQLARVVLAAPGSISGRYPTGNTGGAGVSAFRPMPVPDDLRPLLLAFGENKARAVAEAVEGPISAMNPASILQMHEVAKILLDEPAASGLKHSDYYRWVYDNKPDWQKFIRPSA